MTKDRRLSDFGIEAESSPSNSTDTDATPEEDPTAEETGDGQSDTVTGEGDELPSPSLSTYVWGEFTCSSCHSDVSRLWRSEDSFVCESCKPW